MSGSRETRESEAVESVAGRVTHGHLSRMGPSARVAGTGSTMSIVALWVPKQEEFPSGLGVLIRRAFFPGYPPTL